MRPKVSFSFWAYDLRPLLVTGYSSLFLAMLAWTRPRFVFVMMAMASLVPATVYWVWEFMAQVLPGPATMNAKVPYYSLLGILGLADLIWRFYFIEWEPDYSSVARIIRSWRQNS